MTYIFMAATIHRAIKLKTRPLTLICHSQAPRFSTDANPSRAVTTRHSSGCSLMRAARNVRGWIGKQTKPRRPDRARYVATREGIAGRHAEWEITGPAEIRDVDPGARVEPLQAELQRAAARVAAGDRMLSRPSCSRCSFGG